VRNDEGQVIEIGTIEGNSPRKLPLRKTPFNGAYDVKDIVGATADTKRLGAFHSVIRKDFIDPNDI